jgi:hypothetical protein
MVEVDGSPYHASILLLKDSANEIVVAEAANVKASRLSKAAGLDYAASAVQHGGAELGMPAKITP